MASEMRCYIEDFVTLGTPPNAANRREREPKQSVTRTDHKKLYTLNGKLKARGKTLRCPVATTKGVPVSDG